MVDLSLPLGLIHPRILSGVLQVRRTHLQRQLSGTRCGVGLYSSLVEAEHGDEDTDDEERDFEAVAERRPRGRTARASAGSRRRD